MSYTCIWLWTTMFWYQCLIPVYDVFTLRITNEEFWSPHVSFSVTKHSHYDRLYTCEHGILIGNWLTKNTFDLTNKDWKQLVDKISVSIMDHSELSGGPQLSTKKLTPDLKNTRITKLQIRFNCIHRFTRLITLCLLVCNDTT